MPRFGPQRACRRAFHPGLTQKPLEPKRRLQAYLNGLGAVIVGGKLIHTGTYKEGYVLEASQKIDRGRAAPSCYGSRRQLPTGLRITCTRSS